MRTAVRVLSAAAGVLVASAGAAFAQETLRVEGAARLRIIPEARNDVAASVTDAGGPALPPLRIHREGEEVVIDQGPGTGAAGCMRTGAGLRVIPPGASPVPAAELPRVSIRVPLRARISLGAAAVAEIGAADSLQLQASGCSQVHVGAVRGPLEIQLSGAAEVTGAAAGDVRIETAGSGRVALGRVRGLDLRMDGSGPVTVDAVSGPLTVRLAGSGGVRVGGGHAPEVALVDAGSGDIYFGGAAERGTVTVSASGSVVIARTAAPLVQKVTGSGRVRIGG